MIQPQFRIALVTGSARSGKSEWAEYLAAEAQKAVKYVATAQIDPNDPEWIARIEKHIQRRPAHWETLWVPVDLARVIGDSDPSDCLLVDALGTWVANLLDEDEAVWEKRVEGVLESLEGAKGTIILVGEEVGWGLVPIYPAGRVFRDRAGQLLRRIGAIASVVYLVTGGYALNLTQHGIPLPKTHEKFS
ncbi:bifunctional adenosylcobinamide kinase/adenosylcobinamide-phosphate guanylyltransferase [Lusitaniella coriacea LEGE 07157]|uniref:Adenosylcobinamide kinase n=1 Tax=Lusitaniella coriacea LEGE 07157 TaxID=945747 RepID=A0A8J7J1U3_9CYAN|nr:bifunctional adenosylcobinamide kinase/adenosylcobinamide-phosphate guanylyltransferase [Lusitaniella coriacea]MBE9115999.1 bifunctional adenosylcobinamide kinase/adenosylcobinamide-phosphate guanylyltransferase [Lusitaniella coriacea LEGE 07157]